MSFFPTDWVSFLWGVVLAGMAAFSTGFLKKAGEHAFAAIEKKFNPGKPEPVQVDGKFVPTRFAPESCAWVWEVQLYEYESNGYTHYPHPSNGARCFRTTSRGGAPIKEFLLVQPGVTEIDAA